MSQNSTKRSDTRRRISRDPGVLRLIRRRAVALALGALTVVMASVLTTVPTAAADPYCPGDVGINLVNTIRPAVAQHNGTVPGLYQVFSDSCVAQARATALDNLASQQNTCIGIGTAASGAGGLSAFFSAIAGTAATGVSTVLLPVTGVGGVFMIGVCITIQQNIGNLARHIRGAAQACSNFGIVYEFGSNQGPSGLDNQTFMQNIRCQNGRGGVGQRPPTMPGLDWDNSNNAKVLLGRAPIQATPAKSGGHENVCSGGIAVGATHYVDVPSTTAGTSWTYLSRKLLSRASDATSATYTVKTWNRNTGLYEASNTVTYNCYKPDTPSTVSVCVLNKDVYYTPNGNRTSFKYLRNEGTSKVTMEQQWSHITGLYVNKAEFRIYCPTRNLVFTTGVTFGVNMPWYNGTVNTDGYSDEYTFDIPNLPNDSTVSLSGSAAPFTPYFTAASGQCPGETYSGNPEFRKVTVYSSHAGYPKTFDLPDMRFGSETSTAIGSTIGCMGTRTISYQFSYRWTQN